MILRAYTALTAELLTKPREAEKRIRGALSLTGGNVKRAAVILDVSRETLTKIMRERPKLREVARRERTR